MLKLLAQVDSQIIKTKNVVTAVAVENDDRNKGKYCRSKSVETILIKGENMLHFMMTKTRQLHHALAASRKKEIRSYAKSRANTQDRNRKENAKLSEINAQTLAYFTWSASCSTRQIIIIAIEMTVIALQYQNGLNVFSKMAAHHAHVDDG